MRILGRRGGRTPEPEPVIEVGVAQDSIRLGQFLKLAGLVEHGAQAKEVILAGAVSVNGEVDVRRGRQLKAGDVVSFAGQQARVGTASDEIDVPW